MACVHLKEQCSLRASSPFGGYCEKYTRERHARGDATAGPSRLRRSLARSLAQIGELARRLRAMQPLLNILPCQWFLSPLNLNIQIQILQTGLCTFP